VTPEEANLLEKLDLARLPRHVAVIWTATGVAQKRHLPRIAGHRSGTQSARITIETCARLKIEALTLYAFSVENWRRPRTEIDFSWRCCANICGKKLPLLQKNNIRMRFSANRRASRGVQKGCTRRHGENGENKGMVFAWR